MNAEKDTVGSDVQKLIDEKQELYDSQTTHGSVATSQRRWEKLIGGEGMEGWAIE